MYKRFVCIRKSYVEFFHTADSKVAADVFESRKPNQSHLNINILSFIDATCRHFNTLRLGTTLVASLKGTRPLKILLRRRTPLFLSTVLSHAYLSLLIFSSSHVRAFSRKDFQFPLRTSTIPPTKTPS